LWETTHREYSDIAAMAACGHLSSVRFSRARRLRFVRGHDERSGMSSDHYKLADVAGAILDGTDVDWPALESAADDAERSVLASLRLVAVLADVHRRPQGPDAVRDGTAGARRDHWGHLKVLDLIGVGTSGEVYRAWDSKLDRTVALKLLHQPGRTSGAHLSSVIKEGRLLARVRHANVVTIYGADQIGDEVGLWMELVEGRTLASMIQAGLRFTAEEVARIGIQICEAVAAVHAAGLLHRDIKAQNVMLAGDGRVVLMDLGAGRERADTSEPAAAGTPLYLAPEVLLGGQPSVRSDIYSTGVLLHHLLTAHYPVHARDLRGLRRAHQAGARTVLSVSQTNVPPALARAIDRATSPDPQRRQPDAGTLAAELSGVERPATVRPLVYATIALVTLALTSWLALGARSRTAIGSPAATTTAAVVSATERPIIAVLPLKNLSAEPDSHYFVDGLTDEIIRNLAVVRGLEVRSQTSSFAFKDVPRNLSEVAARLRANLVVEGSVFRSGTRLRINAQLVQIDGDIPLWSERFDREIEDVFAIQDEISRAIVNKLRLTLNRGQRRYDTNLHAYDTYLKARTLMGRGVELAREAAVLFEQVIAEDPAYAPAHAGLASAWAELSYTALGVSADTGYARMRPAAEKALELDPMLAEAHAAMGLVHSRDLAWAPAEKSFLRAIELNPNFAPTYSYFVNSTLFPQGRLSEALRYLQIAIDVAPLDFDVRRTMANVQISAGRYDEAIANCRHMLAMAPDAYPPLPSLLARALVQKGELAEAIAMHEQVVRLENGAGNYGWLGYAYARAGRRAEAEQLAQASADYPARQAPIYAGLGDKDRVFEALERMVAAREPRVGIYLTYPELSIIRDDPRLRTLRHRLRLP
jgi:eukaryotic-like serine/threonine-protein kinase